ncbi:DEAD/DEAH box helicase [Schaalia sp. 19OD2882]|uniref:DEAD/DEAH box helicase n=1 Tax=Schaalia sp. 19OD2882 TaxID=2794089 RepID=UPI001C1F032E|nr:DEAD/DEAH box helicase [Schaalia sp. 19OD2882]QWW18685.1 DEAD/DEAH box helicase [Schaalia sp. 19OD2882]
MTPAHKRRRAATDAPLDPTDMGSLSASQRMRAFKEDQRIQRSERQRWVDSLPWLPDDFQIEAMDALEAGTSLLVAAPTGAGKTVVGEFATHLALSRGGRAFYTTPIKALSNQKFADLRKRFGENSVGLLTGDTAINADAPVVVMTTEVLRNMIYAGADLTALTHVVLDEVHYLADRFRGPVWEEVIIHLPAHVDVVALSATVSNAEEFGAWIDEVRGSCSIIVSEKRPVPLYQHMMVGDRLFDLYAPSRTDQGPSSRLNPHLLAAVSTVGRARGARNAVRETRATTLLTLDRAGLLPAIVFIFSRQGCEDAVRQVLASGTVLTSRAEGARIRAIVDEVIASIDPHDHAALNLSTWARALERGIAAHHAGLLPAMKEAVEQLFTRGLVKVVFATETLALGINMPARTVVIEALRKWNGATHAPLSAGEYTQLSGRAGRRGIDVEGHAVVLHKGSVAPEEVAALASRRTYPLVSAFRPTYNMVVNLLSHSSRAATREVLETSFAQFQADGAVVHLARQAREAQARLADLDSRLECEAGDAREYFWLREELARLQKESQRQRRFAGREEARRALASVRPGDVVRYRSGRRINHALVCEVGRTAQDRVSVRILGTDGRWHHLGAEDITGWMGVVGRIRLPGAAAIRRSRERAALGDELRMLVRSGTLAPSTSPESGSDAEVELLATRLRNHPVHRCPERESHAGAGHAWARQKRELEHLLGAIDGRTNSVAKEFDRVCAVLDSLGFLDGEDVTDAGEILTHVFGERDLVVVEALRGGAFDGLEAADLAALASCFVHESRGEVDQSASAPKGLNPALRQAWRQARAAWSRVTAAEAEAHSQLSPPPEHGLMNATAAWARGASLTTALDECELQGGDFVRWMRQVMDLLDQLRRVGDPVLAARTRQARDLLARGVVSWSKL